MRRSTALVRLTATITLALGAIPAASGCDVEALCDATKQDAADSIVGAWCARFVACGHGGSEGDCVAARLSAYSVPGESGCGASCSEDTSDCKRSTCRPSRVEDCRAKSEAMACAEMVDQGGSLLRFPDFCDSCFR